MELTLQSMKTLSELMDRALELDGAERTRWLHELATGPHAALHPVIADLLARGVDMRTAFMQRPSLSLPASAAAAPSPLAEGSRVGPYVLKRELGRGGMGAVWLAARDDGVLTREVALKLPALLVSEALGQRFDRERDILAGLVHPHIARLYDAGVSAEGRPYLALEYVAGAAITAYADATRLDVRQRLALFQQVAAAVQYAHARLVVHRDLKPANILVSADGQVHLLDFGIAKLLDDPGERAAETELTMLAGRALTLDFASPEQVAGEPIGTASDVYALGVVLYLLLCGSKPHRPTRDTRAALEEAILTLDAPRMSEVAAQADSPTLSARSTSARVLARTLAGDLDTIVGKCLKKSPDDRYGTVAELSADIQRYLEGQPVSARPDSFGYRASKFVLRNRGAVAAGGTIAAAILIGFAVALWQTQVARREAARADAAAQIARVEKERADAQALAATTQRERADREATLARDAAQRADQQASAAAREAVRADRESVFARQAATRADHEATVARRERDRGNAVQTFLMDLFAANSNDQKNAIEVRNLTAKQLLDRGADRLEARNEFSDDVSAALYRFFGELYETVYDYDRAVQMHERGVKTAAAAHGKQSREYALALMELAWVRRERNGNDLALDLVMEAKQVLARVAPGTDAYAQALYFEADFVLFKEPRRAADTATEAVRILRRSGETTRRLAFAQRTVAFAERALGDYDRAIAAFESAASMFATLYGPDGREVGFTMTILAECYRQQLKLTKAHELATTSVAIMRPYRGDQIDREVSGQRVLRLRADLGETHAAMAAAEAVAARITGSDVAATRARTSLAVLMAEIASAQGDNARAESLAQPQLATLASSPPLTRAAVLLRVARLALQRGAVEEARQRLGEIDDLRRNSGFPFEYVFAQAILVAEIAAASGQAEAAEASYRGFESQYATAPIASAIRFGLDMSKVRAAAALKAWPRVVTLAQPWLQRASAGEVEIPQSARGELLLRAGEAGRQIGHPQASAWLRDAEAVFQRTDVASSRRWQAVRSLLP
ncbi:MAG: protein kinase [Burkholderiales bacterium]|nr:protein kinase [Burkholderiales bacterium]